MKINILLIALFLCGCSTQYHLKTNSLLERGNNATIKIVSPNSNTATTQLKYFLTTQLEEQGFKIVPADKSSRYGLVFGIEHYSWQTTTALPIMGNTGIKSIDTTSRGNTFGTFGINRYNTNYYDGTFHAIHDDQTTTNIEYETGIVGFTNMTEDNYQTNFTLIIMDYKSKEIVADSSLIVSENISDSDFAKTIKQIYSQYPILQSFDLNLTCNTQGCKENTFGF